MGEEYHLLHDSKAITTPLGTQILSTKKALVNAIKLELEIEEEANLELLGYYSLFCTQVDFIDTDEFQPTKDIFREYIFNDPVLSASAGPEVIHQYTRWEALFDYLELSGLSYPNFPQSYSYEDKERWIQAIVTVDPGYSGKSSRCLRMKWKKPYMMHLTKNLPQPLVKLHVLPTDLVKDTFQGWLLDGETEIS